MRNKFYATNNRKLTRHRCLRILFLHLLVHDLIPNEYSNMLKLKSCKLASFQSPNPARGRNHKPDPARARHLVLKPG